MNHSCFPNVFWQPVLYAENNQSFLHIAFFALRHIPPMAELTYDYGCSGHAEGSSAPKGRKKCLCGSSKCRGMVLANVYMAKRGLDNLILTTYQRTFELKSSATSRGNFSFLVCLHRSRLDSLSQLPNCRRQAHLVRLCRIESYLLSFLHLPDDEG
ncbi:Histone-lysine N-methyltransferase, H3 lysine-9 specific SUVH3 [Spatholobus suberectus]|nr:Histone-lysine N-methyltransferase, H3 lysine-9 specific SUVH3 [Spatholobus suberectus]